MVMKVTFVSAVLISFLPATDKGRHILWYQNIIAVFDEKLMDCEALLSGVIGGGTHDSTSRSGRDNAACCRARPYSIVP